MRGPGGLGSGMVCCKILRSSLPPLLPVARSSSLQGRYSGSPSGWGGGKYICIYIFQYLTFFAEGGGGRGLDQGNRTFDFANTYIKLVIFLIFK